MTPPGVDVPPAPDVAPPPPPPAWKERVLHGVFSVPGLRSPEARRRVWNRWLAVRRTYRRRLERKGDHSQSRPALFDMDSAIERLVVSGLDRPGYFVEAGANDGYSQSNTYFLERVRGWRGLLVEPIPDLADLARVERPASTIVNCALLAEAAPGQTVTMRYGGLMSIVAGSRGDEADEEAYVSGAFALGVDDPYEVTVPARTLSAVLDDVRAPRVDLMSLDAEGFEPEILKGLDLERHRPRFVLCEVLDMEAGLQTIVDLLPGYDLVERVSPNDVLFRDTREEPTA